MKQMAKIDYRLFPMARSFSGEYNDKIDKLREEARKKFEVPLWSTTVSYVNVFAEMGLKWNQYPKITLNAWKVHLRIEKDLDLTLFPALFIYTGNTKDAGEESWHMYDAHRAMHWSEDHLGDFLKSSNTIYELQDGNLGTEPKKERGLR